MKVKKLLHRLELPENKKDAKVKEKTKILLKNVLTVLEEEGTKLNDKAIEKYRAYKDKTKARFEKFNEDTRSNF